MSTDITVSYVSHQQFPNRYVGSQQVIHTVSALAAQGVGVELVYPKSWRFVLSSREAQRERLLSYYDIAGGFEISPLLHVPHSPDGLLKLSHGIRGPIHASLARRDVVYTRNSIATLAALGMRRKVAYEATRIYGEAGFDVVSRLGRRVGPSGLLSIVVQSEPVRDSLVRAGVHPDGVRVIHNGFDPSPYSPPRPRTEARRSLGWESDPKIVCYSGRIDIDKGAGTILDLAGETPEIEYVLIGYSQHDDDDWILGAAAERGLRNIAFRPWMPARELATYHFASDVLLVPPTADPMEKHRHTVLPMKIFGYMAAGRCIVAPDLPGIGDVLTRRNAVLVEPDDVESAAVELRRILADEARRRSLARQARSDSAGYTWQARARKIAAFIRERYAPQAGPVRRTAATSR